MMPTVTHQQGRDCATAAFQNLLAANGLPLSEAFIFGLGQGLSFWYCDSADAFPVLLGQNCFLEFDLCQRLGGELILHEPANAKEAGWALARVRDGIPTVIKADCFYLDYCWRDDPDEPRLHFGEHVLLLSHIDGQNVWVSDIFSDRLEAVPLSVLEQARSTQEGYDFLLPRQRWYELRTPKVWPDIRTLIKPALLANCQAMFDAKGKFGLAGMARSASELLSWIKARRHDDSTPFALEIIARRMDEGAVGNCFRGLFFEFLTESAVLLNDTALGDLAHSLAPPILAEWHGLIADLRHMAKHDAAIDNMMEPTTARLVKLADLEKEMCQCLITLCQN